MKRAATIFTLLLGLAACGGGADDGGAGATHMLSGMIGGKPWTLVAGETNSQLTKPESYWADLTVFPSTLRAPGSRPTRPTRRSS